MRTTQRIRPWNPLRACSSDVRTPLITSVTVFLVVEYFSLRLTDLLRRAALTAALSLAASARLTWIRRSRSLIAGAFTPARPLVVALGAAAAGALISAAVGAG